MLEVYTLFSSSAGNAVFIRSGETRILIDAGRSRRAIMTALSGLGTDAGALDAVFVTHEHADHVSALPQLCLHEGMPVHASCGTAEYLARNERIAPHLVRHPVCDVTECGEVTVESFALPHDSLCHVGYRIVSRDGDGFCTATDMGHITPEVRAALEGCRGALLEANHDRQMLRLGDYPAALKARILSPRGHLSNEDCARLALYAASCGVRKIGLGHLSRDNNTPAAALECVSGALDGAGVEVVVCARDCVTRIL